MKSWSELDAAAAPVKPHRDPVRWRALTATFVTLVVLAGLDTIFTELKNSSLPAWTSHPQFEHTAEPFKWSQITPKENLEFHKCYNGFECAKLRLPLDYFNGTYPDETVSIAIAKLPARVSVDDPRYGGPILLNPGGPGGSGAWFAIAIAEALRTIVDPSASPSTLSSDPKYFDLIGFDPRGIGESEPAARCLPDDPSAWSWSMRENNEGILGSSDAVLGRLWSMTHAYGAACQQAMEAEDGPDIKQYMATAFVARDMLEITEKHAEYVAKQVAQLSAQKRRSAHSWHDEGYAPGKVKLQYWGFSYGTYLGSTFASMFPDRVGRLILDGVVSSYDYNHSLGNGSLTDSEKSMNSFYTFCHHSGPEECPLATANGTTADVKARFQSIVQSLYHSPLIINSADGPEILTFSDVKLLIFSAIYQPQSAFRLIAELLAAVEAGSGEILDQISVAYRAGHIYHCPINGSDPVPQVFANVAEFAILCGDGIDQTHVDLDEFVEYWNLLDGISPTSGSIWSMLRMRCAAWRIRASYAFEGPYGGNTSHPILFISNTADPVTPLRSGRIMRGMFPGSSILVEDSAGHCSISTPNLCTMGHIRTYFQTGVLPAPETICVPPPSPYSLNSTDPKSPFYDPSLGNANVITLNYEEFDEAQQELHSAALDIQKIIAESDSFGFQKIFGGERARNVFKTVARSL
ncbi:TAP-like protein-domain-containing protein [Pyrenochaeta sp. MPI-SDFR-AT-0127]|nr:TAP-like protein-domain-containing protein [Pyrenochaeta sp. MPI-SDFR-AT-0127]